MKLLKSKFNMQSLRASSAIEFLAVFAFLFVFFILILDVGLFFRQVYLVQTIADEVVFRLSTEKQCSADFAKTSDIVNQAVSFYFSEQQFSHTTNSQSGFKLYTSDNKYVFLVSCRNQITPDSLTFVYKYKGIMMYRNGKDISSNVSVNTTYY